MPLTAKELIKQLLPAGIRDYSIRRNEYLRMGLPAPKASRLAWSVQRYEDVCDARLHLLPKAITQALGTCVDAGAHRGMWSLALLGMFQPKQLIAVECEPRLVQLLEITLASRPGVRVVNAALGAQEGTATFYQLRHPAGSSLLQPRTEAIKEFEEHSWDVIGNAQVRTVTYDTLVKDEEVVSILKLDIQGAEKQVLTASSTGLRKTQAIIIEVTFMPHYEQDATFEELHLLMQANGFGLYRLSSVYHRGGRALFADAVYVREELLQHATDTPASSMSKSLSC